MEGWIQTHSGRAVDPLKPDPTTLAIDDIAHALSLVNRYTGHTHDAYSVGVHSLTVARLVKLRGYSQQIQLLALMHDATEAYLSDIASPIKQSPIFAEYRAAEFALDAVIIRRFIGSDVVGRDVVKTADWDMLLAERKNVLPPGAWKAEPAPTDACEAFMWGQALKSPKVTRVIFLALFDALGGVR